MAHRLRCPAASGIFPNQGSNPWPLHWQAVLNHCTAGEVPPLTRCGHSEEPSSGLPVGFSVNDAVVVLMPCVQVRNLRRVMPAPCSGLLSVSRREPRVPPLHPWSSPAFAHHLLWASPFPKRTPNCRPPPSRSLRNKSKGIAGRFHSVNSKRNKVIFPNKKVVAGSSLVA